METVIQRKPIPKTEIGLTLNQKDILKGLVGIAPKLPLDQNGEQLNLNDIREWERN